MIGNYDNELKNKISEMEQGKFQHLGDDIVKAYFSKVPQSLGSQLGTDKTKAGTPDSFIALENGKFILIEYTTTESQGHNRHKLRSKMEKDIESCLSPNKSHIPPDKIEEILCVYNSNCLDSGDIDSLKEYMKSFSQENILLAIWGVDDLIDTIVGKAPMLAEKYFGLSIWDNQLVSPNQFIREYNRSNGILQIPMDTKLIAREQEVKDIQESFNSCRALILTGDPGVGKTRLALEIARCFNEKGYQAFCIRDKGISIQDDMHQLIKEPGKYFFFIDDANQGDALQSVLDFLQHFNRKQFEIKLLVTVRSYAKSAVENQIKFAVAAYKTYTIHPLNNENIELFIRDNLEIYSHNATEWILQVAQGNPRIAYIVGQWLLRTGKKQEEFNVGEILQSYYLEYPQGKQTLQPLLEEKLLKTAMVLKIFNSVKWVWNQDEKNLEPDVIEFLKEIKLPIDTFLEDLNILDDKECIEYKKGWYAYWKDQTLGNFLLYLGFCVKKVVLLADLIQWGFDHTSVREQICDCLGAILFIAMSDEEKRFIQQEIEIAWGTIVHRNEKWEESFLLNYGALIPDTTMEFVCNSIKKLPVSEGPSNSSVVWKETTSNTITDPILQILASIRRKEHAVAAEQLVFRYLEKVPSSLQSAVYCLIEIYHQSFSYGEFQFGVIAKLVEELVTYYDKSNYFQVLFWKVTEALLQVRFGINEMRNRREGIYREISLETKSNYWKYRSRLWKFVLERLKQQSATLNEQKEIIHLLKSYNHGLISRNCSHETEIQDQKSIEQIFQELWENYNSFELMALLLDYKSYWGRIGYRPGAVVEEIYKEPIWNLYNLLICNNHEFGKRWEERQENYRRCVEKFAQHCTMQIFLITLQDIRKLLHDSFDKELNWKVATGVSFLLSKLIEKGLDSHTLLQSCGNLIPNFLLKPDEFVKAIIEKEGYQRAYEILEANQKLFQYPFQEFYWKAYPANLMNESDADLFRRDTRKLVENGNLSPLLSMPCLFQAIKFYPLLNDELMDLVIQKNVKVNRDNWYHFPMDSERVTLYQTSLQTSSILIRFYAYIVGKTGDCDPNSEFLIWMLEQEPNAQSMLLDEIYTRLKDETDTLHQGMVNLLEHFADLWNWKNHRELFDHLFEVFIRAQGEVKFLSHAINFYFEQALHKEFTQNRNSEEQKEWLYSLFQTIDVQKDGERVNGVFAIALKLGEKFYLELLKNFVKRNGSSEILSEIPLQNSIYSWSGSELPVITGRIEFYQSIINILRVNPDYYDFIDTLKSGIEWLERKKYAIVADEHRQGM